MVTGITNKKGNNVRSSYVFHVFVALIKYFVVMCLYTNDLNVRHFDMVFERKSSILKRDNRVILVSGVTGFWYKMSQECVAIQNKMSKTELLSSFVDHEDMAYFSDLLDKLMEFKIVLTEECVEDNEINSVSFSLTDRCNLQCKHCSSSAKESSADDSLSTSQVKSILDKLFDISPNRIILTGGEPLVRRDFFECLSYIRDRYNHELFLLTNGTLITENNAPVLASSFDSIGISLDGYDSISCSHIRGANVFDTVMNSIELLKANNANNIQLSMTMTNQTIPHVDEFESLNKKLGTIPVYRAFSPLGRGKENIELLRRTFEISANSEVMNYSPNEIVSAYKCSIYEQQFAVRSDGYLCPCAAAFSIDEFKTVNILDVADLLRFLTNKEYKEFNGYDNFASIHPNKFLHCKDCDINLFCFSCPIYTYAYSMYDKENFEKMCSFRKTECECIWSC